MEEHFLLSANRLDFLNHIRMITKEDIHFLVKSAGTSKESEANNFLGTLKKLFFGEVYNKNHYSKLLLIYTNDKIEHNL